MVERPIKKSERVAKADTPSDNSTAQPTEERRPPQGRDRDRDSGRGGKGKGRGKRDDEGEEKKAVNPALLRGPRPVKPKPVEEPVAVSEPAAEEATEDAPETTPDE